MAKNNIRSIRFSDELAELIDRQVGNSFTEKFENLITRCVWELPQKEEQLKYIQEQIERERERLRDQRALLQKEIETARDIHYKVESLMASIDRANEKFL